MNEYANCNDRFDDRIIINWILLSMDLGSGRGKFKILGCSYYQLVNYRKLNLILERYEPLEKSNLKTSSPLSCRAEIEK